MNILLVDDDRYIREIIGSVINDAGYRPLFAEDAEQAMKALDEESIDLVLTDVEMPGMNGFELTRQIRDTYPDTWFPIIFLSGQSDEKHYKEGIDAGGDDYLTKPVSPVVLRAKIRAMERIANMKKALDNANARLEKLSSQDPLTRLYNRRALDQHMLREWKRCKRDGKELTAMMLDIDHFKLYNDHFGHPQGDECLKAVAKVLKKSLLRSHDLVARYGGEEFAIILPETSIKEAEVVCQRICETLAQRDLAHAPGASADRVCLSIGISSTQHQAETPTALLRQADQALYAAKQAGRNGWRSFSGEG
ncbi:GGDEF domain-containing response regulator [Neptuniibacter halophilus]|uniref:GGDEF domain-containing response regulator n=1 Tax=Neptuniibacter halophilus TaxID=651666 RepID=UPI002573A644|nr:diguanylate cyclase [Neptuniibacter halophilus]